MIANNTTEIENEKQIYLKIKNEEREKDLIGSDKYWK